MDGYVEAREFSPNIVHDPKYHVKLRRRAITGTLSPAIEALLWDGGEIYYLSEDRKLMAVSVGPGPSFGIPKPLFQTRVPAGVTATRTHYVLSRDGQRFLVNAQSGDATPNPITVVLNWTAGLKK